MKHLMIFCLAGMLMTGCIKDKQTGADLKVGDVLPDFEVVMNDGSVVTDEILKEKVSVVMFFHTTCPDCQQALPIMQNIYDERIFNFSLFYNKTERYFFKRNFVC